MANDLTKVSGGVIEMGVDTYTPDFTAELVLSPNTKNMSNGINQGTGPRYGISPIPGHSNKDVVTAANGRGLRASEVFSDFNNYFISRLKFLGIVPISVGSYSDLSAAGKVFIWLLVDDYVNGGPHAYPLTATPNAIYTDGGASPNTFAYTFDPSYGFYNPIEWQGQADGVNAAAVGQKALPFNRVRFANDQEIIAGTSDFYISDYLNIGSSIFYVASASMSVSGPQVPQKWLIGGKVTNGSATATALPNFNWDVPATPAGFHGMNSSFIKRDFKSGLRTVKFWNIESTAGNTWLSKAYIYQQLIDGSVYLSTPNRGAGANIALGNAATVVANKAGRAFVAANVTEVLMYDGELTMDSSYKIVLVAAKKALGYFIQDWDRDYTGRNVKVAPLLDRFHRPYSRRTAGQPGGGTLDYQENGVQKNSCFYYWPSYVDGVALPTDAASLRNKNIHITLGAANTGILRANTTYEFTFSVYDKQINSETNVGEPVKFRTGNDDFVRLSVLRDSDGGVGTYQQYCAISMSSPVFPKFNDLPTDTNYCTNYLELRFYYRPAGSFEWLPALFIDAAQYFWWTDYQVIWACEGPIAALPGGQPGGFIDYSFLPDDKYDCVLTFKNRAFWLSPKNMIFSLQNNPFAYPLRNNAPAPTGGYKGAIVHTYRGQSEQESRLVIFGQRETYIGKFTGDFQQMPVAVSPDAIASYNVDGSDFVIEAWTSITAFSYRSAVVADGILYWWGPQGIYRDDGVNVPTKISRNLEPNIFDLYDQSLTDEIHCIYDEKTKDIIWFYPPKTANTKTYAVVYDTELEDFQFYQFDAKIDWAQRISTNNPGVSQDTNGLRTIIAARKDSAQSIQRGYFFDSINRAGDMRPETELLCKSVTTVSATEKQLAFDSGLDATNFATIAVGDYIAIQQFKKYTTQSTGDDIIAKVKSIDTVGKTLNVLIPSGATLPACTPTERFYFPIWHKAASGDGLNGIPWVWESKYWMPKGPNMMAIWQWLYMFFKYTIWKKLDAITFALGYRTASGGSMISDTIQLRDNSDTNFQLYHALTPGVANNQGQAIKVKLSGTHIGEEWALQYLEAHLQEQDGNYLKQYQG